MEELVQNITQLAGGQQQLIILTGVALGVLITVFGLSAAFAPPPAAERRMETIGITPAVAVQLRRGSDDDLEGIDKVILPQDEKERSTTRLKLAQAGYRGPTALRNYYFIRAFLGLIIPLPLILLVTIYAVRVKGLAVTIPIVNVDLSSIVVLIGILVAVGFYGPALWLRLRISSRQLAIREGFPHALDMMQVAIEAGLGFDAALQRVSEELQHAHPILAEEFAIVGLQLRGGRSRDEVLGDLGRRTGVPEISSFTTVIQQSIRFGTNIADALRVFATEMRFRRQMEAEERANKLPVKMSAVLASLMLPTMLILALGPVFIRAIRIFAPINPAG